MKTMLLSVVAVVAALGLSRTAFAQDEIPNNILVGVVAGIEEHVGLGGAQAVFRGGRTILVYSFFSGCQAGFQACSSLMKAGQLYRFVVLNDAGARTILDRQTIQVDSASQQPFIRQRLTIQSNVIAQLTSGVIIIELESDGTVLAAGHMSPVKTALGFSPGSVPRSVALPAAVLSSMAK